MDETKTNHHLVHVEDYERYVGSACVERVLKKAEKLHGFHVSSVEEAAARIVQLIKDEQLRRQMGARGRESVKGRFLMSRLLEQYLDLFGSFETIYRFRPARDLGDAMRAGP